VPTAFTAALGEAAKASSSPIEIEGRILGASGVIVAKARESVLRVAIGPAARQIEEQQRALAALVERSPDDLVADRVPWLIAHGRAGLALWSLERRLAGAMPAARPSPRLLDEYLNFLVSLRRAGGESDGANAPAAHAEVVSGLGEFDCAAEIIELGERVSADLAPLPRGFGHGDFWSGNLLTDDDRLLGVVDWPAAGPFHLPLLDLFHLELNAERESRGGELGTVLVDHLLPLVRSGRWEAARRYCRLTGIELGTRELEALVSAYWLQTVARSVVDPDRDPVRVGDPAWQRANVDHVLEVLRTPEGRKQRVGGRRSTAASVGGTHADLLGDMSSLEAIEDDWRKLAERRGSPFVTPDWYFSWFQHYGERARPFVTILRARDGSVQALMPLVLSEDRLYPTLSFAGAHFGDYFHPVALTADDEKDIGRATAAQLACRSGDWGIFVADYVDDEAAWVRELIDRRSVGLAAVRYHERPSTYLSIGLNGLSWAEYLGGRSINLRGQLGRKLRALERAGEVRFRRTEDPTRLVADMETLFELHHKRWSAGRSGVFASARSRAFHLDFARAALRHGWLRLWTLEVEGTAAAAWYGWRLGDRYLYYQAGFDPVWSRHSPGLLLLAHTIKSALEEGAAEYDMLLGDEAFKSRFATASRTAQTLVLTRPLHPARAVVALDVALRRLARRLPPGVHQHVRESAEPLLRRWPVSTAP
jgi:CelD/BcsL family acetyltransferase involved in cellulose biosynthesis/aminoglycoside phosphotransferase (APT) family kinase protein